MSEPKARIRLLTTPYGLDRLEVGREFFVVIDVLRACTTLAYALGAGARGIIPVETVEEATRLAATLDRDTTLLCGERGSVRVEGFDLGNSPREYTPDAVAGKTLILSTSNGARALGALAGARGCIAASLVTLGACARRLAEENEVTIVCAASGDFFSREDFLCAGRLIEEVRRISELPWDLDDGAQTALEMAEAWSGDPRSFLAETDHGKLLVDLGFEADLALVADLDRFDFAPTLRDGRLIPDPDPTAAR